ncbi:hypothetical protein Tco_1148126 [Tanacetum coccineum]
MESRNASFFENIFPCLTKEIGSSSINEEVIQDKRQHDIMISKMRDKINPRKKRLNREEANGKEPRNRTRPDLAYVVSRLSRYTSNPSDAHWKAMTRVLHYLKYSRDYGLHYDRYPAVIEGYSDANWISDIKDSRSTSGYVFTLRGVAISWKSFKQTVIAKSTMESEFFALDKCGEEAKWIRQFVEGIRMECWNMLVGSVSYTLEIREPIGGTRVKH